MVNTDRSARRYIHDALRACTTEPTITELRHAAAKLAEGLILPETIRDEVFQLVKRGALQLTEQRRVKIG